MNATQTINTLKTDRKKNLQPNPCVKRKHIESSSRMHFGVGKKSCEIQFRITNDNQHKTYAIFDAMNTNRFALSFNEQHKSNTNYNVEQLN